MATRFRQIHLDFHTSEHIPDVGAAFDAAAFADRLVEARFNWITLFGKCHHGMSYYPTRAGTVHPALKFDLLGEQILGDVGCGAFAPGQGVESGGVKVGEQGW